MLLLCVHSKFCFLELEQVPIQVNKQLAYSDGMKVIEPSKVAAQAPLLDGLLFTELDR